MISNFLVPVGWAGCVLLAAWTAGRALHALLTRTGSRVEQPSRVAFMSSILGMILFGYAAFVLGAARLLYAPILVAIVTGLAALGAFQIVRGFRAASQQDAGAPRNPNPAPTATAAAPRRGGKRSAARRGKQAARREAPRRAQGGPAVLDILSLAVGVLFAASFLINALYPVLEHDESVYHLFIPKQYLQTHSIAPLSWSLFMNMPHVIEMIYTFPMAIGDFIAPRVFSLFACFLIITGLISFACAFIGRPAAGLLVLLYVSGRNVQWHMGTSYIETILGAFFLCAVLAFLSWWETRNIGYVWIASIACGAAGGSKYTAWFYCLPLLSVVLFAIIRSSGSLKARLGASIGVLSLCAALILPFLVKNVIYTGNPIYPSHYRLLGGKGWSEVQDMHVVRGVETTAGSNKGLKTYLNTPLSLTLSKSAHDLHLCSSFSATLMVLFLAAFLLPSSWRAPFRYLLIIALGGYIGWAWSIPNGRYLVAWVPVMTLAASLALLPVRNNRWVLAVLAIIVISVGSYQIREKYFPYALHTEILTKTREELLPRNLNYDTCEYLNRTVPATGKILVFFDNRFFFLQRPFFADSVYEAPTSVAWLRSDDDPAAFARDLASQGFTHVVVRLSPLNTYFNNKLTFDLLDDRIYPRQRFERDKELFERFVNEQLEQLQKTRNFVYYRLKTAGEEGSLPPG